MTFGLLTKQPDRGQSCACPHLLVSGCFTRPPGTSTRNHPHEPTTSKPVVPGGYVLARPILVAQWPELAGRPHGRQSEDIRKTRRNRTTPVPHLTRTNGFRTKSLASHPGL